MIIYKDILTGDEMFSDAYPSKLIAGVVYEVDCKTITRKNGVDIDIGANASAEGGAEELDDSSVTVINVVDNFRLNRIELSRKDFSKHFGEYMTKLKALLAERGMPAEEIKQSMADTTTYLRPIVGGKSFGEWDLYQGESMEPSSMLAFLNYREDGITPYFLFLKHGLVEEKV